MEHGTRDKERSRCFRSAAGGSGPSTWDRRGRRPARGAAVPRAADAQVLYGSLTGNVTDPTGAVAVGAKVQALNVGTNVAKTATTDDRGAYLFSDLCPASTT